MAKITYKAMKVEEIDLTNKLTGPGQKNMNIEQRAKFNVQYSVDRKHCRANLVLDFMEKDKPMDFNFKISTIALFDCDPSADEREIHKMAYDEMYPMVRAVVTTILVNSGLPAIPVPKMDISADNIRLEKGQGGPVNNGNGEIFS